MKKILSLLLVIATFIIILYLLFWRYKLGLVRYFDPDEFIYLNLAAHVNMGYRPYTDFLFIMTPLYLYILTPLYRMFGGIDYITGARIFSFIISVIAYLCPAFLFWTIRKSRWAITAVLFFIILPMPSDKLLEIRPDILAMIFFFYALIFQIRADRTGKKAVFLAGLFYSISILTCQKVLAGVIIAVLYFIIPKVLRAKKEDTKKLLRYFTGLTAPWAIFTIWSAFNGDFTKTWYSIGRMVIETQNYSGSIHSIPKLFFFLPNVTYYGAWGWGLGIAANHLMWIVAIILCFVSIIKCMLNRNSLCKHDLLVGLVFLSYLIFYFFLSPLRHPQYLIGAAFLVPYYLTDPVDIACRYLSKRRAGIVLFALCYILLLVAGRQVFFQVHNVKFAWGNSLHFAKIKKIWEMIPRNEYVLDLEGRTIDYPYPYYGCCYAIGQFDKAMSKPMPSLSKALFNTKTRYIYQAEINRIDALLPRDVRFIHDNYAPAMDNELWVAKNW